MFRLDDRTIQYPYAPVPRITSKENNVVAGGGPLVVLIIWAIATRPGVHKTHVAIVGLLFSIYLTTLITDILKKSIGRPRPDLIARCQPEPGTPEHALVSSAVCTQPNLRTLLDGFESFPSGHSSWAFSGLGYLSMFMAGQMHVFRPHTDLASILIFLAPLLGAALVAMSRLADYRHDIYDVSSGSLLGLIVAYITYRRDYRPLTHPECDTPYTRLAENSLALAAKPRFERQLSADDFEDIELLETFHISEDDADARYDIELGYHSDQVTKHDAMRTAKRSSRRSQKLKGLKNSSTPPRRGRQHFRAGQHVVSRLRRLLIRNWRESSLVKMALILLGLFQSLSFLNNFLGAVFPDGLDLISGPFKDTSRLKEEGLERLTAGVQPVMCHSHDDFFRHEPLYQAIRAGCTSVEADVWHAYDELYVAHTAAGIRQNRTLKSLYLDPIQDILNQQNRVPDFAEPLESEVNGVFLADPRQSLVLLVEFKNDPEKTWHRLAADIAPFRESNYLTYFNGNAVVPGPLTIVASGSAPFNYVVSSTTYRDIFYDSPLDILSSLSPRPLSSNSSTYTEAPSRTDVDHDSLSFYSRNPEAYSPSNSYFASASFIKSIGYPWHSSLSQVQLDHIRRQIRGAHSRGLKVRYWGIPPWPIGLRNYIWRVLVREGVDYLSVDNIDAATKENWGPRKGGWGKKWWL
ncbi:Altered inheritance of mitochondria protein 6 [Cladophialophora chaetospira]|uniref:Altered inheritance of mitochondria protein 6 n=1 Tax=Cladophialophora chaetospira TaxID=386627 RepID=A0AA38XBF7_9EURO|nr:Altered inheritance of mitochondria protein 6 [Cladophialophora chaetospira]